MTDIEKAARAWADEHITPRTTYLTSKDLAGLAFIAGAESRDAEVEALKAKIEALRQMCGEIGEEWSCDVVDFANNVVQLLDKDSHA